jgi:hypothetical protein
MALLGTIPVPNTPAQAIAALDAHLPLVLRGQTLKQASWRRPDLLTLLIPVMGFRSDDAQTKIVEDEYLLRLRFGYYPEWPPSAQFINPLTNEFRDPEDKYWLPRIEGTNEIQVHANYGNAHGQVVCCSVTLEFYQVNHGCEERHIWDAQLQNFAATVNAITSALRSSYYKGRQAEQ